MKTKIIFLIVIILVLVVGLIFSVFNLFQITGGTIQNYYTYTKAVCDETNYCEDYVITCQDEELVSMNPTGAAIQFSKDWQDPRDKEIIERICDYKLK